MFSLSFSVKNHFFQAKIQAKVISIQLLEPVCFGVPEVQAPLILLVLYHHFVVDYHWLGHAVAVAGAPGGQFNCKVGPTNLGQVSGQF